MDFWLDYVGLFLILTGFVIGLGAVNVIDFHAWLGRHSEYWTEAATRTHKITKPLIWLGMLHVLIGGILFYRSVGFIWLVQLQLYIGILLALNGAYLTFRISPLLLKHEREGRAGELIPKTIQRTIAMSFIFSFIAWWSELALFTLFIVQS